MRYIEAPSEQDAEVPTLFLAGGITDCPDWQAEFCHLMQHVDLTILNPRRKNFPIGDPDAAFQQIEWEHCWLQDADAVLYWFSRGSLNPIVLYEYGMRLGWRRNVDPLKTFVGCDPEYPRIQDVHIQTKLEDPSIVIHDDLLSLSIEVATWVRAYLTDFEVA